MPYTIGIVKFIYQNGTLPRQLLGGDLMTHDVISCDATDKIERLEQLMIEHQVRHIPITHKGKLSALVNTLDIVNSPMQSAEKEAGQLRNYVFGVAYIIELSSPTITSARTQYTLVRSGR
jgi:predicted transcriptional regulator